MVHATEIAFGISADMMEVIVEFVALDVSNKCLEMEIVMKNAILTIATMTWETVESVLQGVKVGCWLTENVTQSV